MTERDIMLKLHMASEFDMGLGIERLLIRGKLDDARYFAQQLATVPDFPGVEPWASQLALVRERAGEIASAPSLDEACRRTARLAEACASCHTDASAQVDFGTPLPVPVDQPTVAVRMARHRWAANRLWEGLTGDSDGAWTAGLDVLADMPLSWSPLEGSRAGFASSLQRLADAARHVPKDNRTERSRLFGEILVTCAACHTAAVSK